MRKIVSIILALFLTFSISTTSFAHIKPEDLKGSSSTTPKITNKKLTADIRNEGLKDNDKVRVIVELTGKPSISYATERGVKVNQLEKSFISSITNNLNREQQQVKNQITSNRINIQYHNSFTNVSNGFSATVTYGDAKRIENLPGVSRVVIANKYDRPTPDMKTSHEVVKSVETWNLGYNGEGMVIAIIDTGIDPSHKDMKLTDASKAKLNPSLVNGIIASEGLKGKWYTNKVPYGYNYYDKNNIILDLGPGASMHGMHVAGTSGANGDSNGIKGVAPESQLLAMKVFSNDPNFPSTYGDIYMTAIDDCVKLGVDVINMSLGSSASFVLPTDPEQIALTNAANNGIVLAMSAGNAGNIGDGWMTYPYAKNPDLGVVGAPGSNANSVQVAAVEKSSIEANALRYKNGLIGYTPAGNFDPIITFSGPVEYVYCKLGLIGTNAGQPVDDFAGVDVAGKIALIQRGGYAEIPGNFVDKIMNAQNKGAIGVIVFNSRVGGEALMNMAYPDGTGRIPAIFIGISDGNRLRDLIPTNENKVEFKDDKVILSNPNAGTLASFSSWGSTPNLDFKPEITAPGVNIYSTFNNNTYGYMSGTSMASPHVAGGSSLILQRVDKEFGLKGYARSLMTKNLLLSTATPLVDNGYYNKKYASGSLYSPRRQGAGVMNLLGAATTPAIVTEKITGISKASLKEIGNVTNFTLKVTNFSNKPLAYNVSGTVGTDLAVNERTQDESQCIFVNGTIDMETGLGQFPISFSKNGAPVSKIDVPANGSTEFNVTIDLSNTVDWFYNLPLNQLFPNGTFVEGFVRLESPTEDVPAIGVPYMGFYGEWDKAPIIDDTNYDENPEQFYGNYTLLTWKVGTTYNFLGYTFDGIADKTKIAFSPNGDKLADEARLVATFLRNAKDLEINILNKDGTQVRALCKDYDILKDYYNSGDSGSSMFRSSNDWAWDGKIQNKIAPDGEYIYEVKARVDYPNARWQRVTFPVVVDNTKPIIENMTFNPENKELTVQAKDNHAISHYELYLAGNLLKANSTGIFDLSSYIKQNEPASFTVKAYDYALNSVETIKDILASNDTIEPVIFIDSPEVLGIYATNQVLAKGYVTDNTQIASLTINGEDVPLTLDAIKKEYHFEKVLNLTNAVNNLIFEAKDIAGNKMSILRKVFVDTKAPVIAAEIPEVVEYEVSKLKLKGLVSDNMPSMKVYVNSDMVANKYFDWIYLDGEKPVTFDLSECEVALALGDNTIIIEAKDDAGNITTKEYHVFRKPEVELPVEIVSATVTPDQNIFVTEPALIQASANQAVDWEVSIIDFKGDVVQTFKISASPTFNATWAPDPSIAQYGLFNVVFKASKGTKSAIANVTITTNTRRR